MLAAYPDIRKQARESCGLADRGRYSSECRVFTIMGTESRIVYRVRSSTCQPHRRAFFRLSIRLTPPRSIPMPTSQSWDTAQTYGIEFTPYFALIGLLGGVIISLFLRETAPRCLRARDDIAQESTA
jgi:hypothetical protein